MYGGMYMLYCALTVGCNILQGLAQFGALFGGNVLDPTMYQCSPYGPLSTQHR